MIYTIAQIGALLICALAYFLRIQMGDTTAVAAVFIIASVCLAIAGIIMYRGMEKEMIARKSGTMYCFADIVVIMSLIFTVYTLDVF